MLILLVLLFMLIRFLFPVLLSRPLSSRMAWNGGISFRRCSIRFKSHTQLLNFFCMRTNRPSVVSSVVEPESKFDFGCVCVCVRTLSFNELLELEKQLKHYLICFFLSLWFSPSLKEEAMFGSDCLDGVRVTLAFDNPFLFTGFLLIEFICY